VGWELVVGAVAGEEGDGPPVDLTHVHGVGGGAPGRVHLDPLDVVEQRVEARSPEHPDLGRRHGREPRGWAADRQEAALVPEDEPEDEPDPDDELDDDELSDDEDVLEEEELSDEDDEPFEPERLSVL